jgi:sulfide:quinone oxidoreductase
MMLAAIPPYSNNLREVNMATPFRCCIAVLSLGGSALDGIGTAPRSGSVFSRERSASDHGCHALHAVPTFVVMKVAIAGGGVAALEAALALRELAQERVEVEVIAPDQDFVYRPLAVADPFRAGETRRFPLRPLVESTGASLFQGHVVRVDPARRVVATADGGERPYEKLLVALGARPRAAVPETLTFWGPESTAPLEQLLEEALDGQVRRIVFALPAGVAWPLPLYELALLTRAFLVDRCVTGVELELVTPEEQPLALFGAQASEAMAELLGAREIALRAGTTPVRFDDGVLQVAPDGRIEADQVVALPQLYGPSLVGLPSNSDGFIPIDSYCRVGSEPDVYAAGDATQFPLKQGGIATQQADVAAAGIAAAAGATVEPEPFKPVLRGLLLTGMVARFLRSEPGTAESAIDTEPLWAPPAKIVGHYLAPFLASKLGLSADPVRA